MSDSTKRGDEERQFTIQPHPATTNDPNNDPALGTGGGDFQSIQDKLMSRPGNRKFEAQAAIASHPGPQIVTGAEASKVEQPKSHEELQARAKELNK